MGERAEGKSGRGRWYAAVRCVPFTAVVLCFLLPLFTVSSCSDDSEASQAQATATGVDVVLGRIIYAHPTAGPDAQASADVQAEAQSISRAARPWAIITLILCGLGIALALSVRRHPRLVNAGVSAATFGAVIMISSAVSAPVDGSGQGGSGLLLATLVLLLSLAFQVCVFIWLAIAHALRPRSHPSRRE
jgi:hypothetical protein